MNLLCAVLSCAELNRWRGIQREAVVMSHRCSACQDSPASQAWLVDGSCCCLFTHVNTYSGKFPTSLASKVLSHLTHLDVLITNLHHQPSTPSQPLHARPSNPPLLRPLHLTPPRLESRRTHFQEVCASVEEQIEAAQAELARLEGELRVAQEKVGGRGGAVEDRHVLHVGFWYAGGLAVLWA